VPAASGAGTSAVAGSVSTSASHYQGCATAPSGREEVSPRQLGAMTTVFNQGMIIERREVLHGHYGHVERGPGGSGVEKSGLACSSGEGSAPTGLSIVVTVAGGRPLDRAERSSCSRTGLAR